jgi:PKD repeat protein
MNDTILNRRWPVFLQSLLFLLLTGITTQTFANENLVCSFTVVNNWGSGAVANLQVTNTGAAVTNVDPITVEFTDATRITHGWNAAMTGGNPYTFSLYSWNSQLPAGQSLNIGMQLSVQNQIAPPVLGGACDPGPGDPPGNQPPVAVAACDFIPTLAPTENRNMIACDASGSSDPDGDALTYRWDFGDGAVDSGVNVSHEYAASGVYIVTLTANDGELQSTDTARFQITLENFICEVSDLDIHCEVTGAGDVYTSGFNWDFGDGNTAAGTVVDHSYALAGTYTVELTIFYESAPGVTLSKTYTVSPGGSDNQPPEVVLGDVHGMQPGVTQDFTATASDLDGNLVSWELTVYLDTIDGPQNPVVIDSGSSINGVSNVELSGSWSTNYSAGYILIARVTDSFGETATASEDFAVNENPAGTISISHADTARVGEWTSATATSWHPTQMSFTGLSIRVQPGLAFSESSTSSSSGGPSIGYKKMTTLTFMPAVEGTHTITATDSVLGLEIVSTMEVLPAEEEPESTGDCINAGIDPATVNAYPDWPRLDWKGDPSNANTGDLMQYEGSIYRAKWWTTSIPGSDPSWEFVCQI